MIAKVGFPPGLSADCSADTRVMPGTASCQKGSVQGGMQWAANCTVSTCPSEPQALGQVPALRDQLAAAPLSGVQQQLAEVQRRLAMQHLTAAAQLSSSASHGKVTARTQTPGVETRSLLIESLLQARVTRHDRPCIKQCTARCKALAACLPCSSVPDGLAAVSKCKLPWPGSSCLPHCLRSL